MVECPACAGAGVTTDDYDDDLHPPLCPHCRGKGGAWIDPEFADLE